MGVAWIASAAVSLNISNKYASLVSWSARKATYEIAYVHKFAQNFWNIAVNKSFLNINAFKFIRPRI